MRIGIDASRAAVPQPTGTERYSRQLIRHLLRLAEQGEGDRHFILYTRRMAEPELSSGGNHYQLRHIPFPRLWTHLRLSCEMALHGPDVLFVPAHVIPLVHPRASVATVHDLGHLYFPEAYPKGTLRYLAWSTRHNVRSAAHLLADSETTKADLVQHFSVDPQLVTVVYPGVDPVFQERCHQPEGDSALAKYGIRGPYLLYVGALQPRKNVGRLIEAFARVKGTHRLQEQLVLAGPMGWLPEGVIRRLEGVGEDVVLTGYVPEKDLVSLYAGATAFVLPSLFEGFGMPVVEAMASGAPVLVADTSALPEVVGDAGVLFDPYDTDELAEALARVCADREFREQLRSRGRERAKRFTWEEAARTTLQVLEKVGGA